MSTNLESSLEVNLVSICWAWKHLSTYFYISLWTYVAKDFADAIKLRIWKGPYKRKPES